MFDTYNDDDETACTVYGIELTTYADNIVIVGKEINPAELSMGNEFLINENGPLYDIKERILNDRKFFSFTCANKK